ncbi:hypothetical protein FRC03_009609 [Tulasnella sp. 419]|nr:hypothetical protein FRC03_009609 [Tulasnella sp. 419]
MIFWFSYLVFLLSRLHSGSVLASWVYPDDGWATLTHYDLPRDYIASCGCVGKSTHYPTAALSTLAYGSTASYGPSCGRCFRLTLLNTFLSDPPFYPEDKHSIMIKVTDRCPGDTHCGATEGHPNSAGAYLNFDLAYPSSAIPDDFFPSNVALYGYKDFGVWNISYESISCSAWGGWKDQAALGSVPELENGACCPAEVSVGHLFVSLRLTSKRRAPDRQISLAHPIPNKRGTHPIRLLVRPLPYPSPLFCSFCTNFCGLSCCYDTSTSILLLSVIVLRGTIYGIDVSSHSI